MIEKRRQLPHKQAVIRSDRSAAEGVEGSAVDPSLTRNKETLATE